MRDYKDDTDVEEHQLSSVTKSEQVSEKFRLKVSNMLMKCQSSQGKIEKCNHRIFVTVLWKRINTVFLEVHRTFYSVE